MRNTPRLCRGAKRMCRNANGCRSCTPWAFEQGIPASRRDSCAAQLSAAARESGGGSGDVCPTPAEGVDGDEYPTGQRDQRHQWYDWNGHPATLSGENVTPRDWRDISTRAFAPVTRRSPAVWKERGARSCYSWWRRAWNSTTRIRKRYSYATSESTNICTGWRPKSIRPATRYRTHSSWERFAPAPATL